MLSIVSRTRAEINQSTAAAMAKTAAPVCIHATPSHGIECIDDFTQSMRTPFHRALFARL